MTPTPAKTKSGRGCFLYGCLSLVVLFILVVALGVWGIRHYVGSAIEQFTEATPQKFEPATLPEAESRALQERLQNFARDLQQTNPAAQLTLDSRELNAVIATEPSLAELKDSLRVQFDNNEVRCQLSVPLDPLANLPFLGRLKGRYLNATANVQVALENGTLTTRLVNAQVKGVSLPPEALARIEKTLPWEELRKRPEIQELLNRLDWLKIADGKLQLGTGQPEP
jgi:hypothetical protein